MVFLLDKVILLVKKVTAWQVWSNWCKCMACFCYSVSCHGVSASKGYIFFFFPASSNSIFADIRRTGSAVLVGRSPMHFQLIPAGFLSVAGCHTKCTVGLWCFLFYRWKREYSCLYFRQSQTELACSLIPTHILWTILSVQHSLAGALSQLKILWFFFENTGKTVRS